MKLIALALFATISFGATAEQKVLGYSGTDLVYVCTSPSWSDARRTKVAISGISKAAAAVVTSAGHGFPVSARPSVTISGATGTGWVTGVNGTFVATVLGVDTFSIPVDSQGFGTLAGTVVFTTTAPRTTIAEWLVQRLVYSSNVLIWTGWQNASSQYNQKCSEATSAANNQQ